jgi:hypothetical protein
MTQQAHIQAIVKQLKSSPLKNAEPIFNTWTNGVLPVIASTDAGKKRVLTILRNELKKAFTSKANAITPKGQKLIALCRVPEITTSANQASKANLNKRVKNRRERPIKAKFSKLHKWSVQNLFSEQWYKSALAIQLLTGRRFVEVMKAGTFSVQAIAGTGIAEKSYIRFTTTAKTDEPNTFVIPVLHDSTTILKAVKHLRTIKDVSRLSNKEVDSSYNGTATKFLKANFGKVLYSIDSTATIATHTLRKVYVRRCIETRQVTDRYNPTPLQHAYAEFICGHQSEGSTNHYEDVEIID